MKDDSQVKQLISQLKGDFESFEKKEIADPAPAPATKKAAAPVISVVKKVEAPANKTTVKAAVKLQAPETKKLSPAAPKPVQKPTLKKQVAQKLVT